MSDDAKVALQRVVDAELASMQHYCLLVLAKTNDTNTWQQIATGSDRIAALACFVCSGAFSRQCRNVRRYLRLTGSKAGRSSMVAERLLCSVLRCRAILNRRAAKEQLRFWLLASLQRCISSAATTRGDASRPANDSRDEMAEGRSITPGAWLRHTWPCYADVRRASCFFPEINPQACLQVADRNSAPQGLTAKALLKSLMQLQQDIGGAGVGDDWKQAAVVELARYLHAYQSTSSQQGIYPDREASALARLSAGRALIRDLIQLAGAILAIQALTSDQCDESGCLVELAHAMISRGGAILHLDMAAGAPDPKDIKQYLGLALQLERRLMSELPTEAAAVTRPAMTQARPEWWSPVELSGLTADVASHVQNALRSSQDATLATVNWRDLSEECYRLLVRLRMLSGAYTDSAVPADSEALKAWLVLLGSVYRSVGYCHQLPLHTAPEQERLLVFLQTLPRAAEGQQDSVFWLHSVLTLEARLAVTAGRCWQAAVLELDAEQDDFDGQSVHQALACGLRLLPAVPPASGWQDDVQQEILNELRFLLKGARVLGMQRIESLVWVMIEACQAQRRPSGTIMRRAHRSLCRMLDQAAAWQPPGNARRMINTVYATLEQYSSDAEPKPSLRELSSENDSRQQCLGINRRLRRILRQSRNLDNVRVLMQELLRSQEDLLASSVHYASSPATRR